MNRVDIKKDYVYYKKKKEIVIYHIADIHFNINTKSSLFDKILKEIKKDKPNYIIITGDLLDTPEITKNKTKIRELVNYLSIFASISKVIISLGNHDTCLDSGIMFFKKIREIKNIYVLINEDYSDDYIYVYGMMLPSEYYYNVLGHEDENILINLLKKTKFNMPKDLFKIGLFHSPVCLTSKNVINYLKDFNLILSGHMHSGMVPNIISKYSKGNSGIIGPFRKWFPKICRGKLLLNDTLLIINGGVTKLSYESAKILSRLNFLYNISINKIILTNDRIKCLKK